MSKFKLEICILVAQLLGPPEYQALADPVLSIALFVAGGTVRR